MEVCGKLWAVVGLKHLEYEASFLLRPERYLKTYRLTESIMHLGIRPPRVEINDRVDVEPLPGHPVHEVDSIHLDEGPRRQG